jgi:hypothetical protein
MYVSQYKVIQKKREFAERTICNSTLDNYRKSEGSKERFQFRSTGFPYRSSADRLPNNQNLGNLMR